ncbi:hypothetical protein CVS24_00485 [Prochlorococcus marinus str. XMU1419]|nr:hypothetical protein [Prochlorococcus marinus str. XMU1419]
MMDLNLHLISLKMLKTIKSNECILCNCNSYNLIIDDVYPFKKNYKNISCKNCGLTKIHPFPKMDVLRDHYKNYRKNTIGIEVPTLNYESDALINANYHYSFFREYLKSKSTILDVGCGAGTLLSCAVKDGHKAYGVNPDPGFAKYGVKNYGIKNMQICMFEDAKFNNIEFDMITFNHVFEHFIDPISTLIKVWNLLKEKGYLYLSIPDNLSPHGQLEYNYFDEHIYTYDITTIENLLKIVGFKIIKFSNYGITMENNKRHPWIDLVAVKSKPEYVNKESLKENGQKVIKEINNYKKRFEINHGKIRLKLGIISFKLNQRMNNQKKTNLFYRILNKVINKFAYFQDDYCGPSIYKDFPKEKVIYKNI